MSSLDPTTGTHAEAYCSTGTSPGATLPPPPSQSLHALLPLDGHGPVRVRIGYELQGPGHAPVTVVLGGISAGRHLAPTPADPAPGWWPGVVGAGGPLDPGRRRLLGIDYLAGPGCPWPRGGPVTPADQARALNAVLDHLGIRRADVVGASYGGMVALALATSTPERVRRLAVLCATHRPHPWATAVRTVQRGILKLAVDAGRGRDGVSLARSLAMTTYRTPAELEERFDHRALTPPHADATFPVDAYLRAAGDRFAARFDAVAFARLSESIDLHDVDPARLRVPTHLLSVDSDLLAPPWLVRELAEGAPGVRRHLCVRSRFGHDAFLKETQAVSAFLEEFLGDREVAA